MKNKCQSVSSKFLEVAGNFFNKYQEFRKDVAKVILGNGPLGKLAEKAIDLQTDLIEAYNKVADDGPMKIGFRAAAIPSVNKGDLLLERTFVLAPIHDTITCILKKTGGKGGVDVTSCLKTIKDGVIQSIERSIDKGKDTDGKSVKWTFENAANKIIVVHLKKTGFPTNTCDYTLELEGEYDKELLKKEEYSETTMP